MNYINQIKSGCKPDTYDDRDYKPIRPLMSYVMKSLPEQVDNTSFIKIVDDQGNEGACTGSASSKALELAYKKHKNKEVDFSIRFAYELGKRNDEWIGEDYEGSSIRGVLKGMRKFGCCTEEQWEYIPKKPGDIKVKLATTMWSAMSHRIKEYFSLFGNKGEVDIWKLKSAISQYGFAVCGFYLPTDFGTKFEYNSNSYELDMQSMHAMLVVGYTPEYFIIQNSWGKDFGKNGQAFFDEGIFKESCFSAWSFMV